MHAAGSGTTSYVYAVETVSGAIRATVRVTDAAGRWKKHVMDGLGNLREVREPKPGAPGVEMTTVYLYNGRDQLKQVTMVRDGFQGGGAAAGQTQTRTFNYNAGGQLTSTVFPENGTTTYTYQNGKMYERIDAVNRKTRWVYTDGRLTRIERYPVSTGAEDTTQRSTYYYDITPGSLGSNFVAQNTAGRPVAIASGPFREFYSYTPWGALAKKRVEHPYHGTNYNQNAQILEAALTYDAQGRVSQMLYPSGTLYQYDYHADTERQIGLKRWNPSTSQWISAATAGYGFRGEMTSMSWGDPNLAPTTTQTWAYNALGQMTSYNYTPGLSPATNVTYSYGPTPAAGKLDSMTVGGVTTTYGYDEAGRLLGASTPTWTQGYVYDGFGNLVVKLATGAAAAQAGDLRPLFDSRKNNFTGSPLIPTAGYDVEGRLISNTTLNETYGYDASNKRVLQRGLLLPEGGNYDTARLTFWLGGQRLGAYSWRYLPENQERPSAYWEQVRTLEDIYIGGKRVEPSDRLGSNIISRTLLPYGEELTPTPHGGTKFATYQRDSVGQDYADQRYYSVGWGRFYSVDPLDSSGRAHNPSSWNRYTYVLSDPVNFIDPTGEECNDETRGSLASDIKEYLFGRRGADGTVEMKGLVQRWNEQVYGKYNPIEHSRQWSGHNQAIEDLQRGLRRALDSWNNNNCGDPPESGVWKWATRGPVKDEEWVGPDPKVNRLVIVDGQRMIIRVSAAALALGLLTVAAVTLGPAILPVGAAAVIFLALPPNAGQREQQERVTSSITYY